MQISRHYGIEITKDCTVLLRMGQDSRRTGPLNTIPLKRGERGQESALPHGVPSCKKEFISEGRNKKESSGGSSSNGDGTHSMYVPTWGCADMHYVLTQKLKF